MKNKILSLILIFSLVFNFAVLGTFIYKEMNEEKPFLPWARYRNPRPFNDMKLNREQRHMLFNLIHEFHSSNSDERREIDRMEREMLNLINQSDYDSVKINSLIEQIAELRLELSKKAIRHFQKFKEVLTKEQQAHFMRMIMENRPGRDRVFSRGPGNRRFYNRQQADSLSK